MSETFERFVARVNANGFLPQENPTGAIVAKPIKLAKGKEFTFASPKGGGQVSKYPWDEWFAPALDREGKQIHADGQSQLMLLERSEGVEDDKGIITTPTTKRDFEVQVDNMPGKLKNAARRRYKVVQISRRDADGVKLENGLIIRARDMDAAERQAEDLLRAEEKADSLTRKAEKKLAATNGQTQPTAAPAPTPQS